MKTTLRWVALAGLTLAPLALATPARAAVNDPTPEGTVITNTATVSWTDANGNTYTPVTASASVTVGFVAGPDVSSPATVTPASPSTGNELPFTITNSGNGVDSVSVSVTAGTGVTITGYKVGVSTYPTLGELNEALSGMGIPMGGNVVVTVVYTVAPGTGGQTIPVTLTATSRRTPSASDASTTNVAPPVAAGVSVTPDGATVQRLPSNGTQYTATFTVQNNGNASDTFTLAGSNSGSVLTIVSVNGTAGTGSSITIASGASSTVDVVYTVANGAAAGATDNLTLTATSDNDNGVTDTGYYTVTVIRAAISMTKDAYRDNQSTTIGGSDRVLPGEYIQYRIAVTNTGGAAASGVSISDALPAQLTYVSSSGDAAGWTIGEAGGTVTASLSGTLEPSTTRFIWIRVQVK